MKFFITGFLFVSLVSCGSNENKENSKIKQEAQQAEKQQTEKFTSIGACLKQKKEEAGLDPKAKPTPEILAQCLSSM